MNSQKTYDELLDLLSKNLDFLPDKPEEDPISTLHALWRFSCGCPINTRCAFNCPLPRHTQETFNKLKKLIERRIGGTPLAHIIGVQHFMGVDLMVDTCAFIPRKETEILGFAALDKIRQFASDQPVVRVMDMCTGMGNLALAFAIHEPNAKILASDISEQAIALAVINARKFSLNPRVEFFVGDLFEPFSLNELASAIDVITCNPPYISAGKISTMPREIIHHEPRKAFDGGIFGLKVIMRLIWESVHYLRNGGWLCFEVGLGQGEPLAKIMERNRHFRRIEQACDINGNTRAILAQVKK